MILRKPNIGTLCFYYENNNWEILDKLQLNNFTSDTKGEYVQIISSLITNPDIIIQLHFNINKLYTFTFNGFNYNVKVQHVKEYPIHINKSLSINYKNKIIEISNSFDEHKLHFLVK